MLTGSDLLKSSRTSSIFTNVITLREKQSPTSFWKGAEIASAKLKIYFNELSAWQVFVNCIGPFKND
jgi:hypothetical protein